MPSEDPCVDLQEAYEMALPERLRRFFSTDEHRQYRGRKAGRLPGFASDVTQTLRVDVDALCEAQALFAELNAGAPRWGVVAVLGDIEDGARFMVADLTQPALPVHFFDYEEGLLPYAESFDAFLGATLDAEEPSPVERLQAAYEAALAIHERGASSEYPAVIAQLAAALTPVAADPPVGFDSFARYVGGGYDLLGKLELKLGDAKSAAAAFRAGLEHRSYRAGVSLLELHFEQSALDALVELGEHLRGYVPFMLDDYVWEHTRRLLARAYVRLGDEAKAVLALHDLRRAFAEQPEKLETVVRELRALSEGPHGAIATRAVRWLSPAPRVRTPEDDARIEAAWALVPRGVQRAAKLKANLEKKQPSVDELAQILRAEELDLRALKLSDLSFLGAFNRLRSVNLGRNGLSSLRSLPRLEALETLEVAENALETLEGIEHAPRLVRIACEKNRLTTLAGIEALVDLREIDASENLLEDLTPLASLPELEKVRIHTNQITDLTPLASCPRLENVTCFSNPLETGLVALAELRWLDDLDDLVDELSEEADEFWARRRAAGLDVAEDAPPSPADMDALRGWWRALPDGFSQALRRRAVGPADEITDAALLEVSRSDMLHLGKKGIADLEPIRRFERATWVKLSENQLEDLEPLRALTRLRTLYVDDARVVSLAPLAACSQLESLQAARNRITSLAGLEASSALRKLDVTGNAITSLAVLADKTELRHCALGLNAIESLAPLSGLSKLRTLSIQGNRITDLSPLATCAELEVLICFANPGLRGLMALAELPRLRQVHTHCGVPDAELERFRAARPGIDLT
jgi:internalin A